MERKLIALPSIEDLERESKRTGVDLPQGTRMAYASAQARIEQAHITMAKAALRVVNPQAFENIDRPRRHEIQRLNYEAGQKMRAFFTETCTGFVSDDK